MLRDKSADLRAELEVAQLAMLKEPHEAVRVLTKNFAMGGKKPAVAGNETIEFLAVFFAEGEKRADAVFGTRILLELEGFHQRGRVLIDVAGVAVVVPHERLGAAQDVALRVVESGGDDALKLKRELIGGFAAMVVEFVADAVDEVEGGLKLTKGSGREQLAFDKILEPAAAAFHARNPLDALVIAQSAAAFLHIWLLQENRVRVLFMSAAHVLAAQFEKGLLALVDAFFGEA